MKSIETRYDGVTFRSRLEARWAIYFNAMGIEWQYEPEGFDLGEGIWYVPDFWFPQVDCWAEVKPFALNGFERAKASRLCLQSGFSVICLIGVPQPICYPYFSVMDEGSTTDMDGYLLASDYLSENRFFSDPPGANSLGDSDKFMVRACKRAVRHRFDSKRRVK